MIKPNRIGTVYGSLLVVADMPPKKTPGGQSKRMLMCRCNCGKETQVMATHLQTGRTTSCGCIKPEASRKAGMSFKKHGHWIGNKPSKEWMSWRAMRNRCYNKNHKDYKYWGARGIVVCERWNESFENFFEDMGAKPSPRHSIDRINNDGNYEPSNCRWATPKEQIMNRRNTRRAVC